MYFYITSLVNGRHKVGITDNLEKRILNYATLVPDIKYLVTTRTGYAKSIESGFKHRFLRTRPKIGTSLHRSKFLKGETYPVKYKYLFLYLIHALHCYNEPLVYVFHKNEFLNSRDSKKKNNNRYSIQLSNYYISPKDYFKSNSCNYKNDGSLVWDGREAWFEIGTIVAKNNTKAYELMLWNVTKNDIKRIHNNISKTKIRALSFVQRHEVRTLFTKGMKHTKTRYKKNWSLEQVAADAKKRIFRMLCDNKILRPYKIYDPAKYTTRDSHRYKVLQWLPYKDRGYAFFKKIVYEHYNDKDFFDNLIGS